MKGDELDRVRLFYILRLTMGADSIHTNKGLFSDHYLDNILSTPDGKKWRSDETLEKTFDDIRRLYEENQSKLPQLNERQLEEFFIAPVLKMLGHFYIPQPREETPEGIKFPDYALYDTESSRGEALELIDVDWNLYSRGVGLCEAKKWNRKLDVSEINQPTLFESRNPAYQMQRYLYYSDVKWGILTNGKVWRLYEREQSKRLDRYYQIDLVELLSPEGSLFGKGMTKLDRLEAFKYFYLFFRRQAFPDFLDYVLQGSVDYAQAVGAELKDNVYKALRLLAQGFVSNTGNKLDSLKHKEMIRENCFVLLYRLLFVLFAESKHLLPVIDSPDYKHNYSLHHIKEEITSKLRNSLKYSKKTFSLWEKLASLFTLINVGDDTFRIPPYNGGLFDNEQHQFFNKYKVADWYLAEIINLLCTAKAEGKARQSKRLEFIDYSSLEVRDLGSIYEGLLENRLEIAEEPMIAVRNGKQEKWKKEVEKKEKDKVTDRVDASQYYPVFKRDERKATGSYYTPDYIVEYIVEHTLGPLAEKCKTEDELLSLRVLDPAIGSGHFLVEATDFLARQLLGKKEVEETEDEIGKAKRLIIERCIFGVDKNLLAVELAKLSLWLHTVARDKPLSFLDHHLRCGDSLIGAKVTELGTLPGEEPLPLFQQLVEKYSAKTIGFYKQIEDEPSDTLEQIHEKTRLLETARTQMLPFRTAADVWISTYFGNEVKPADYSRVIEALRSGKEDSMNQFEGEEWFVKANQLWAEHRFFHWVLEFAEVFFDEHGRQLDNPGFDAVIGNPPYLYSAGQEYQDYYSDKYELSQYQTDYYVFFVERGILLCKSGGNVAFIVSDAWLNSEYFSKLRNHVLSKHRLETLAVFDYPVFDDVALENSVFVLTVEESPSTFKIDRFSTPTSYSLINTIDSKNALEIGRIDPHWSKAAQNIVEKIEEGSQPISFYAEVNRGIHAYRIDGYGKSKFGPGHQTRKDQQTRSYHAVEPLDTTYLPELKGKDIGRFNFEPTGEYLSYGPWLAEPREPKFFFKVKVVLRKVLGVKLHGTYIKEKMALDQSLYILISRNNSIAELKYLLGVLLSRLGAWYIRTKYSIYDVLYPWYTKNQLDNFPVKPKDNRLIQLVDRMLDLNKRKQEIEKDYTGWLAHLLGAKLDELTGKSKIRDLEKLTDFNQLAELLKKNRKRTGFDTENDLAYTKLRKGFERFKEKLDPVVADIEKTDKDIDCLVYKLYELTPKEIEIVEGE